MVEVLFALGILAIGGVSVIALLVLGTSMHREAQNATRGMTVAHNASGLLRLQASRMPAVNHADFRLYDLSVAQFPGAVPDGFDFRLALRRDQQSNRLEGAVFVFRTGSPSAAQREGNITLNTLLAGNVGGGISFIDGERVLLQNPTEPSLAHVVRAAGSATLLPVPHFSGQNNPESRDYRVIAIGHRAIGVSVFRFE